MATTTNRLSARGLSQRPPGMHADGNGLYLRVDHAGGRSWMFVFFLSGKRREMGLGSLSVVGLAAARERAARAREDVLNGVDPIKKRRSERCLPSAKTFAEVAERLMDELEPSWKSPKQRPQWRASLTQHAAAIWTADVASIDTEMVLSVLQPIWHTKTETAQRIRGRIERVLDAAKVRGLRSGENPARWKGHLSALLASNVKKVEHFAALPYADVPELMKALEQKDSMSALALRFAVLTACRSNEVRAARWSEIQGGLWTIPAERMKAKETHQVPLSSAAVTVLNSIPEIARGEYVFALPRKKPMTDVAISKALKSVIEVPATVHGLRSTFRDWAGDCTNFQRELIEEALAHKIGNAVERSYRRSKAIEKRRELMTAWARYCSGEVGQVHFLQDRA